MRFLKRARVPQKRLRSGFTVPLCRGHHRQLHQTRQRGRLVEGFADQFRSAVAWPLTAK